MQERFPSEHGRKLFGYSLEQLLDSSGVTNESRAHLETARWDIANGCFHVVGDPIDKVAGVFVLYVQHLFVHLFHGHATPVNINIY